MRKKLSEMVGWMIVVVASTAYLAWLCWNADGPDFSTMSIALIRMALVLEMAAIIWFAKSELKTILAADSALINVRQPMEENHDSNSLCFASIERPLVGVGRKHTPCAHRARRVRLLARQ